MGKPAKRERFVKFCKHKTHVYGTGARRCVNCGRYGAHIRKYNLHVCRQCFRELAQSLGFKKMGSEV